jgi:hypothetical protein
VGNIGPDHERIAKSVGFKKLLKLVGGQRLLEF